MSIEGLFIGFIILSIVALIVAAPLMRREPRFDLQAAQLTRQRDRALVYYERVLRNIRDLDEDQALGKLDADAYAVERALWTERGVQVLKALEQLDQGTPIAPRGADDAAIDDALGDAVEAAVRAYRQKEAQARAADS